MSTVFHLSNHWRSFICLGLVSDVVVTSVLADMLLQRSSIRGKPRSCAEMSQRLRAREPWHMYILQGKVEEERSRGRPARQWLDDVKEWMGLNR